MSGTIDRRAKDRWRARHRDPAGRMRSKTFTRRVDAQRWLAAVESEKARGDWLDPNLSKITVGTWARSWLAEQVQLKPATQIRYDVALRNQILPTWEHVPLHAVSHPAITTWVQRLCESGLAPATVRYAYRVLSLLLSRAVRDGRIGRNPAEGTRLPRTHRGEMRFLDHHEVDQLARACGQYDLMIRLLAYTGMRWGEVAALRVRNVDLDRRRIDIVESASEASGRVTIGTPKSHQSRWVPVPLFLANPLAEHIHDRRPMDLVFTGPEGGPLRNSNFRRRVFDRATRSVDLDGLRPHDLRHTAASLAVASGANVKAVQQMLGHASAAMTLDVYAGLFGDDLDALGERLHEAAMRPRVASVWPQGPQRLPDAPRSGGENAF